MNTIIKKPIFWLAIVAVIVAVVAFQYMQGPKTVKIGLLMGVTGPIPDLVKPMVETAQLAVTQINAAGGVLGETLVSPLMDGQCNAQTSVDATEKLINVEQVTAIVGEVCSGATIGAAETVAIPAGVVMISPSASSPAITGMKDNDLLYRTAPSDAYQGVALAKLAMDKGMKKVALTYANDDYNIGIAGVFRDAFTAAGGTIVADQAHEPEKNSYRSELATLATGEKADALVLFAYYNSGGITILRQSMENALFSNYIGADGMMAQAMVDDIGAKNLMGNSWFTANTVETSSPSYQAFEKLLKDAGSTAQANGPYIASSYDAMFLAALAIQANGSKDRKGVAAALRAVASAPGEVILPGEWSKAVELLKAGKDINYEGASGSLDFDAAGDVTGVYSVNIVQEDGKITSVDVVR